ncbi:MAG: NAD(P)/FAD-dependent oxidoreductase, partial [Methanophagales archaeon]|nr:NAD(P)/FAD-dependent oxidoreductase [Methanophagales archaeon]
MLEYDVVVVGAGPSGCMAAKYVSKAGASTLIVEKGAELGEPIQCAGLISKRAIEESELK